MGGDNSEDTTSIDEITAALEQANKLRKMATEGGNVTAVDKQHNVGVIQGILSAVADDKNYRQILKQGLWKSPEEMDKAVNALACCDVTGAKKVKRIILDKITAHSAGVNGYLLRTAIDGLNHSTYTMQGFAKKPTASGKSGKID
jgi:hypothetical protein